MDVKVAEERQARRRTVVAGLALLAVGDEDVAIRVHGERGVVPLLVGASKEGLRASITARFLREEVATWQHVPHGQARADVIRRVGSFLRDGPPGPCYIPRNGGITCVFELPLWSECDCPEGASDAAHSIEPADTSRTTGARRT